MTCESYWWKYIQKNIVDLFTPYKDNDNIPCTTNNNQMEFLILYKYIINDTERVQWAFSLLDSK